MTHSWQNCFFFLIDGLGYDRWIAFLKKKKPPHLTNWLSRKGALLKGQSVFPSTTGPAYLPLLTGLHPGAANIPGIRWFDRQKFSPTKPFWQHTRSYCGWENSYFADDLKKTTQSFFSFFKKPYSFNNFVFTKDDKNLKTNSVRHTLAFLKAHFSHDWLSLDRLTFQSSLAALDNGADCLFSVFPGVDEISHLHGVQSPKVDQALFAFDDFFGKFLRKLTEQNRLQKSLLILTADHGLSDTQKHFDLGPWLNKQTGFACSYHPFKTLNPRFNVACMVSGNSMAHLYFKKNSDWQTSLSFEELFKQNDLFDRLCDQPAIQLLIGRALDQKKYFIMNNQGQAYFYLQNQKIFYQWLNHDPLSLFEAKTGQKVLSLNDAYELSLRAEVVDLFEQIPQLFQSRRCGDVLVLAKKGYDLRYKWQFPKHVASHGALNAEQMFVPFMLNQKALDLLPRRKVYPSPFVFQTIAKAFQKENFSFKK